MVWILIDWMLGSEELAMLKTDEDGELMRFDTKEEAVTYGKENLQEFQPVELASYKD